VLAPYFYRYSDSDVEEFFRRFAAGVNGRLPIYLYNLPQFGNVISTAVARNLFEAGLCAGIKDSSGDWSSYEALNAIRAVTPFQLIGGHERLYLRQRLSDGVDGVISGISAGVPELVVALSRAVSGQKMDAAKELDGYVQEFIAQIQQFPTPAGIKLTAAFRGWPLDQYSFPFGPESSARMPKFREWLTEWLPRILGRCTELTASKY
jgi:dihydrodipicolinate synthase/N-acetylneuraminate lyase